MCEGLQHAHGALGPTREPLGLVHRDVSPQNIILSPEGMPKLLDFGVAKARGRLTTTEAGTLKGKLRYMAPEQIQQGPLDHRADVFSVGVLLCEATTGRNPFGAKMVTEVQLFKNIVGGNFTPPSELLPGYPKELERIVLWAIGSRRQQALSQRRGAARRAGEVRGFRSLRLHLPRGGLLDAGARASEVLQRAVARLISRVVSAPPRAAARTPASLAGGLQAGWGSSGAGLLEGGPPGSGPAARCRLRPAGDGCCSPSARSRWPRRRGWF